MKKIFKSFIILFVFCLTLVVGNSFAPNASIALADSTTETTVIKIGDEYTTPEGGNPTLTRSGAQVLEEFVDGYDDSYSNASIVLTSNIDMTGRTLKKTIGSDAVPFVGTFNGCGYTISNLTFDLTDSSLTDTDKKNIGLFGVTDGAKISNLMLQGDFVFKSNTKQNTNIGALVAKASNTKISMIQSSMRMTSLTFDTTNDKGEVTASNQNVLYDTNVECGGLVGIATNSTSLTNCVVRPTASINEKNESNKVSRLNFKYISGKISSFGGIVGRLTDSQIYFNAVLAKFTFEISSTFVGTLNFGGIVGTCEGANTQIINNACDNTFSFDDTSIDRTTCTLNIGEVCGRILTEPLGNNISYIKFNQNDQIARFGDSGRYTLNDNQNMILSATGLESLESTGVPTYFANNDDWSPILGGWDFDSVWYSNAGKLFCQSFYNNGKFDITVDTSDSVINFDSEDLKNLSYRYGESAQIKFSFKNDNANFVDFYDLSYISVTNYKGKTVTERVVKDSNDDYAIVGSKYFALSKDASGSEAGGEVSSDDRYILTIKNIDCYTTGLYKILTSEKKYALHFETKLFDGDEESSYNGTIGYVYNVGNFSTSLKEITLNDIVYGSTIAIETRPETNTPHTFVGWYIESTDGGEDTLLSQTRVLSAKFGEGFFETILPSYKIYAKYAYDPYYIIFDLGGGISEVHLNNGAIVIKESTKTGETGTPIAKTESALKLEIYVKDGYSLNTEEFEKFMTTYRTGSSVNEFCKLKTDYKTEDGHYYLYILNISMLDEDKITENRITIKLTSSLGEKKDLTWLWITLGCGGGVILIAVIIIIIVVIKRRNGFGGGMRYGRKNFKNNFF